MNSRSVPAAVEASPTPLFLSHLSHHLEGLSEKQANLERTIFHETKESDSGNLTNSALLSDVYDIQYENTHLGNPNFKQNRERKSGVYSTLGYLTIPGRVVSVNRK